MNRSAPKGFNLLELMICISIISILSGIGVQYFSSLMQQARAHTTTNELLYQLYFARSEAIKRNSIVTLCPSQNQTGCIEPEVITAADWSKGWIIFEDDNNNQTKEEEENLLLAHTHIDNNDQLYFKGALKNKTLQFDSMGSILNNASFFLYCPQNKPDHAKTIVINRIGRARVTEPAHRQCLG